jgi:hypothetical protein
MRPLRRAAEPKRVRTIFPSAGSARWRVNMRIGISLGGLLLLLLILWIIF